MKTIKLKKAPSSPEILETLKQEFSNELSYKLFGLGSKKSIIVRKSNLVGAQVPKAGNDITVLALPNPSLSTSFISFLDFLWSGGIMVILFGSSLKKLEKAVKFRVAKITPTKTRQFVTIWKRKENGPIEPFELSDDIDFLVISTRKDEKFGQFIFPRSVLLHLLHKCIITGSQKEGKRAMRVYPPWAKAINQQAIKSQQWQLEYFLKIPISGSTDLGRAKMLFEPQAAHFDT